MMSTDSNFDYLKPYLDATASAASRHRAIVVVMVTTSILVFGTLWNSFHFGWFNSRVNVLESACIVVSAAIERNHMISLRDQRDLLAKTSSDQEKAEIQTSINKIIENVGFISAHAAQSRIDKLESLIETELKTSKTYLENRVKSLYGLNVFDYKTIEESKLSGLLNRMEPIKAELEKVKAQSSYLIRIPFFGIAFEVNDLGFLGGATFVVLLVWFELSLWTEVNNLQFVVLTADSKHVKFCYHYLAMQQVLTIPPEFWKKEDAPRKPIVKLLRHKPSTKLPKILYFLPLIVQALVFGHDLYSYRIGLGVSPWMTHISASFSFIFLVLIGFLTYRCIHLTLDLDKVWRNFASQARESLLRP